METPKDQNLGRCQNFHQLIPQHIYDAAQIAGPELGAWRRLATPCTMASPRDFNDRILELHNLPAARKSLPIHKSKKQIDEGFTDTLAHARTVTKAVGGWLWSLKLQRSSRLWVRFSPCFYTGQPTAGPGAPSHSSLWL